MRELPTELTGIVTPFAGNGRKFGYPTANIASQTKLTDGVYFGFADLADYAQQPVLIFIGTPTTVGDTERRVEAHILDIPDQDYYDQQLVLSVQHYHRANQTFDSIDKLLQIMKEDESAGRQWFKTHHP